ncbi:hypothetical protein C1645_768806 [Glomus cerebriforme]|uniref:Uncharacterized protein n=1 Tax=Glomus cerebriforme TaxID=658196 RepID=A0A397SY31_9GLOM|nr:hypothetical protein C1645_768806 [Glomus cerebriforme]
MKSSIALSAIFLLFFTITLAASQGESANSPSAVELPTDSPQSPSNPPTDGQSTPTKSPIPPTPPESVPSNLPFPGPNDVPPYTGTPISTSGAIITPSVSPSLPPVISSQGDASSINKSFGFVGLLFIFISTIFIQLY